MARRKRKKLNKKVVAVLAVLGLAVVALGGLMAYKYWPKDPVALKNKAEAALKDSDAESAIDGKNYEEAVKYYGRAIGAAKDKPELQVSYCLRYAELNLEWLKAMEKPQPHQQRERIKAAVDGLETARLAEPDNEEVLEELLKVYSIRGRGQPYLDALKDLIDVRPEDAELRFERARTLAVRAAITQGEEGLQAIESFKKAIELDPNNAGYRVSYARFLHRYERTTQSEEVYRQALKDLPDKSVVPRSFGQFLASRRRLGAARDQFQEAIRRDPNDIANHLVMASFLLAINEREDAEVHIAKAEELEPNSPSPQIAFAKLHARQRDLDKAARRYRKAIDLVEKNYQSKDEPTLGEKMQYRKTLLQLHNTHGNLLMELVPRQPANKEKLLGRARESLAYLKEHRPESAERFKLEGRILLMEGETEQALTHLEKAWAKYNERDRIDSRTGDMLAAVYLAKGRPARAKEVLSAMSDVGRRSGMASLLDAGIEIKKRNYAKAAEALEEVLRRDPTHARALNLHRAVRVILSEATELPDELEMTGEIRNILLREADRRWLEGNRAQAIALVESMYQREPEQLRLINRLTTYYRRSGQDEKIRRLLQQASRAHPDNAQIRSSLELLDIEDPAERYKRQLEMVSKTEDPVFRAMAQAQVAQLYDKGEQVIEYWTKAAELAMEDPQNPDPRAALLISRLLRVLHSRNETEKVEAWLKRAARADLDGAGGALFRADVAMLRDDYKEAISLLEPVFEEQNQAKRIAARLGRAHLELQQYQEARKAYEAALSNDAGYTPAVIGMMRVSAVLAPDEYPEWVRRAYRLAPQNTQVRSKYIDLKQQEQSDPAEILAQREELFRNDPRNMANTVQLAMLYERNEQPEKAESIYRFLYENLNRKLVAAEMLSRFYRRQNQSEKARKLIEELRENKELDQVAVNLLEAQILAQSDFSAARKAIERAMDADPKDPRPYRMLTNLWLSYDKPAEAVQAAESLLRATEGTPADEKRLIRLLMDSGQPDRALQRLENMLAKDPSDAEALTLKGVALMKPEIRRLDDAMNALDKAIELRPRYAEPYRFRSLLYQAQGKLLKAISDLRQARQLQGDRGTALRLAALLIRRGDYVPAEDIYKGMLRNNPDDRNALDGLTNLYMMQENWLALEQLLNRRKEAFPQSTAPYIAEARMWARRDQGDRRIEALSKAVEIARTPTTVSRYLRGLVETGRHADALEALEGELPEGLGDFPELIKASALAGTGQSDQAEEIFRGILAKVAPQRTPLVIGMVTAGFGREQGLKRLVRWIDLRPKDSFYIQQVASLVGTTEGKGSWEKSAQLYGRAVGLAKKQSALRAQALTGLGVAEYNLKNYKKARDAYLQALDIRANDIQALNNLAYLYVDGLDDAKKGLTYAKQAIEYQPRNPNVLDTYGWALAKVGRLSDAEKALEQAVRQSRTPVALYHLGWVYEQSGRLTDGLRFYRDALVLLQEGTGDPSLKPRLNEAIERVEKKRADKRSSS